MQLTGANFRSEADAGRASAAAAAAAAADFDANAQVADEEFPTMEEAVMLSRGIRTSVNRTSTGNTVCVCVCVCVELMNECMNEEFKVCSAEHCIH